jgi:hypothetical protein
MPDARLDTMRSVEFVWEFHLGAGVLRLVIPGMVVGVIIDLCCAADALEATSSLISAMLELLCEVEGVVF